MKFRQSKGKEGGFSLIEVAVALMVIGLLVGSVLSLYNIHMARKRDNDTKANISTIEAALNKYVTRNGRYPRPAHRDIPIGTAGFGKEAAAITLTCGTTNRACVTTGAANVYVGDVPFASLGIRYTNAIDSYGAKLVYAISVPLTTVGTFSENAGAINVIARDDTQIYTAPPRAHYFVYSAGPDGEGVYSLAGTLIRACGTAANGKDFENCDNDGDFRSNFDTVAANITTYRKIVRAYGAGVNQFDDWSAYRNSTTTGLWTIVPSLGELVSTNSGANLIIGTPSTCGATCVDPPKTTVEVQGAVRADEIRMKRICYDNAGCNVAFTGKPNGYLSPSHYAGVPDITGSDNGNPYYNKSGGGILCPYNRALRGFQSGDELCSDTATVSNPTGFNGAAVNGCNTAVTGKYAIGIDATGRVKCTP